MHPQAGADMDSANPYTPLVVAATYGLADCIKYLLEAGANPNIPDEQVNLCSSYFLLFLMHMVPLLAQCVICL